MTNSTLTDADTAAADVETVAVAADHATTRRVARLELIDEIREALERQHPYTAPDGFAEVLDLLDALEAQEVAR